MEKLKMQTADMAERNIEILGQMFPNCLTEVKNDEGKTVRAIDIDKLRQELACEVVEGAEERYQFTWPDKRNANRLANSPTNKTLRPCREESVDFDNTENLYIEGDNLEVLKLLRENYLGKVKMIYIDPPYNTGNDFVYNDDFAKSADEFNAQSGLFDEEGNRMADPMVQNTESNGRFHTDWLNMIYPRLKVAKDLLSDDGAIFISIDDHEVENLRKICDELFGESNFVAQMIWEQGRKSAGKTIAVNHEYCLIYCKSLSRILQLITEGKSYWKAKKIGLDILYSEEMRLRSKYGNNVSAINKDYKAFLSNLSENSPAYSHKHYKCIDERGIYFPADASAPDSPETRCHKPLLHPITMKECKVPRLGWRYKEATLMELYNNQMFHFGNDETTIPCIKRYLRDTEYEITSSVIYKDGRGASNRLASLLDKKVFDFPKDEYVIQDFIKLICLEDKISTILDFFSGSATTAHAVMQLNAEDGGNRRFIMVQLPELTDEKSEARKAGYKNICEIGKERIRRAGKKISDDIQDKIQTLGFTINSLLNAKPSATVAMLPKQEQEAIAKKIYNEQILPKMKEKEQLELRLAKLDTGFRVLKLDTSNMKDVYYTPADTPIQQTLGFDELVDNIKWDERTPEDLLFQVLPECNLPLSSKIEEREIHGKKVFVVEDGYLIACFDKDINESVITAIAKEKPYYFVMCDRSIATDNVADNFDQIFNAYSKETVRKIL
ncbi:MAG: site-specific DNA-methyltransferase [Clostridia bacterium]|nr:site-specific DNA-methyltransferase [Clostridia bacterium]